MNVYVKSGSRQRWLMGNSSKCIEIGEWVIPHTAWILICRHVQLFLPFLHDWGIHSLKLCYVWKTVIRVVLKYRKRGTISTNIVQWYSFWTEDHCHHVITTNIQLLQVSDYTNSMLDMVKRHQRLTNTFCIKKYYSRLEQTYIYY